MVGGGVGGGTKARASTKEFGKFAISSSHPATTTTILPMMTMEAESAVVEPMSSSSPHLLVLNMMAVLEPNLDVVDHTFGDSSA
jgi:hypothetical protein